MRTLKRPMFNKGGSTNEGIMTGLVDRRGYSNGDGVNLSRDQYKKFQSLDPIDLRKEWEKQFTAEGLQQQGTYVNPLAGQYGFDVASQGQLQDIDWFSQASPQLKEADFLAWKEAEGKDLVAKQKEYEELSTIGEEKLKPDVVSVIEKKPTDGGLSDTNRISQQLLAQKKETLSEKAKRYANIMSPGATKKAIFDSLAAASEKFGESTGDTKQDIANAITAAAKVSGGASDILDKANLLALQEEIQTNIAKATYKPNVMESTINFYRSLNMSDAQIAKKIGKDTAHITDYLRASTTEKSGYKNWALGEFGDSENWGGFLPENKSGEVDKDKVKEFMTPGKFYWDQDKKIFVGLVEGKVKQVPPK